MLVEIPISKPNYNIDSVSKSVVSDAMYDCYLDESGSLRRRGALVPWVDTGLGLPGRGIFNWKPSNGSDEVLVVRCGTHLRFIDKLGAITAPGGVFVFNDAPTSFASGAKADGTPWLYLFDGGYPTYSTYNGALVARLGAGSGAPSAVKFGAWLDGRFLVGKVDTNQFYASDTNPATGDIEPDYFLAAANPLNAEVKPDTVNFIGSNAQELDVWGKQGKEVWVSDSFFSPIKGAFAEAGLLAPYSVAYADDTVFALCLVDGLRKRAVVKMSGRSPQVVSWPIEKILAGYSTVDDAIGMVTGDSEYILTFPTEGVTWCYDYRSDMWYRWSRWAEGARQEFLGRYSASAWGKTFFQSRLDGNIYEYRRDTYQDATGIINTEWVTGWIDREGPRGRGTRCKKLRVKLKRGAGDGAGGEPVIEVRWRDNGREEWKTPRMISLGEEGQREFFKEVQGPLGIYQSRQYAIRITDNTDLALVRFEEDVEYL